MESSYPAPEPTVASAPSVPDTADFEALLQAVLKPVYSTALYLTRNAEDAEDLVQDSAILAFRAFASFEPDSNFKAWFLKILHNRFLERMRTAQRRPQTVTPEDDEELDALYLFERTQQVGLHARGGNDPAGAFLRLLDGQEIRAALAALPDEFRVVATLYFVEEQTYEQIAVIVDCPLNTVRSRLHRSRRLLQRSLWDIAVERGLVQGNAPGDEGGRAAGKAVKRPGQRGLASWLLLLWQCLQPFR